MKKFFILFLCLLSASCGVGNKTEEISQKSEETQQVQEEVVASENNGDIVPMAVVVESETSNEDSLVLSASPSEEVPMQTDASEKLEDF